MAAEYHESVMNIAAMLNVGATYSFGMNTAAMLNPVEYVFMNPRDVSTLKLPQLIIAR